MASTEETLTLVRSMRANHELHVDHSTNVGQAEHAEHGHHDHDDHLDKFEAFIQDFKKSYADKEEVMRLEALSLRPAILNLLLSWATSQCSKVHASRSSQNRCRADL